jgi:hypothetical protein
MSPLDTNDPEYNKVFELVKESPADEVPPLEVVNSNKVARRVNDRFDPPLTERRYVECFVELEPGMWNGDELAVIPQNGNVPLTVELREKHFEDFVSDAESLDEIIGRRPERGDE